MKRTTTFVSFFQAAGFLKLALLAMVLGAVSVAHAGGYGKYGKSAGNDIVDTASSAGGFNTLLAAAKAAGLVDTLKGDGPFTLFAPTDEAFAQIPEADLNALLKDKQALTKVLTNHLIKGKMTAGEVVKLDSAQTLAGQSVAISTMGGVKVNDANVIKTDIMASNGVIHVVDKVIMPTEL